MATRGPDGTGAWLSPDGDIGLGHRRLAIIDLSPTGKQPMSRADGRYQIVFNGEIYNYRELRRELAGQGVEFLTQSDTEVILALYEREGVAMLPRLRGMYGLALWDVQERRLLLARDPYGIKPLYYASGAGSLRFASQVKALQRGGGLPSGFDPAGLVGFLLWGTVPEPHCLQRGVRALPAGHCLLVEDGRVGEPQSHYDFGARPQSPGLEVTAALEDSVRAHLVADVPVGVFLSAGLDSGLIAAMACRHAPEPLTTFTLAFEDYRGTGRDEAPLAAEVARALGANHVERQVRREEFLDLWPSALAAMDQPSIDGFNTYVVSHAAHQAGFKVVLSGLGGDELLGSYDSFRDVPRWARWASRLGAIPGLPAVWPGVSRRLRPQQPKLAGLLRHGATLGGSYFLRRGLFLPTELPELLGDGLAAEGLAAYDPLRDAGRFVSSPGDGWESVHRMESTQYMRNQLLRDSDWASMAHSLELRVPLVDARLRAAMSAADFEPARGSGKAEVVRRAAPELPAAIWERPKSGFSIPVMEWLDEQIGIDTARGLVSRKLALKVLEEFGLEGIGERAVGRAID